MTESGDQADNAVVAEWVVEMHAQDLSARTIKARVDALRLINAYTGREPEELTKADIVRWLASGRSWSKSTRATYFGHVRAWSRWLLLNEYRADDPTLRIRPPKRARSEPRPIATTHLVRLLAMPRLNYTTKAKITLIAFTGARVQDVAKVAGRDIDVEGGRVWFEGKGGVRAWIPLHPVLAEVAARMPKRGHWFTTHVGPGRGVQPVTPISVSHTISNAMARAGVPGSAHSIRHWYGTTLLEKGVDLRTVQELMRHASVATTQIYTQVAAERRTAAIARLDPWSDAA